MNTLLYQIKLLALLLIFLVEDSFTLRRAVRVKSGLRNPICQTSLSKGICNEVRDYPGTLIKSKMVLDPSTFKKLHGGISTSGKRPEPGTKLKDDGVRVCSFSYQVIFPQAAQNLQSEWKYVVNVDEYKQGVQVETCKFEGSECEEIRDHLPFNYESTCKQLYITRVLVSLDSNDQNPKPDKFNMPSACVCFLRRSDRFKNKEIRRG